MEQYKAEWYSQTTKATVDISGRCGNLTLTDDLDALALKLTLDVQQSLLDPYHTALAIAAGDRIRFYKDGALVLDGQVNAGNGNKREKLALTCYDDGVVLAKNDILIQFNGVSAAAAIGQLCGKLGIAVGSIPALTTSISGIYHTSVSSVLGDILDTVAAETGKEYFVRVRKQALHVLEKGKVVTGVFRLSDNLPYHPIQDLTGAPEVQWSIEDLRNSVQVYSQKNNAATVLSAAEDAASVAKYGRRMALESYSDSDGATAGQKAKTRLAALNAVTEEFSVPCYGADSVYAGAALTFAEPEMSGTFLVQAVTKKYGHPYTMDLTLRRIP